MNRCFVSVALVILLVACAGCGKGNDTQSAKKDDSPGKPRIALIMKSLANEFFLTMEEGARAHNLANPDAYELITEGIKDELDVNRQIQLVEQMMSRQVDAIVIAPADSKALISVCHRAMDTGIVVVNIDNKFDDGVLKERGVSIPFVGPNNRTGAYLAGAYLAEHLEKGDPVAIIEGVPSAYNGIQRKLGFEDAMKERGMQIVASQVADWEMAKANRVAAAIITEEPALKAFLCANDSMALGTVAAVRAAGKQDQVKIVGFDNISAAQELIAKEELLATVDQHADQLAVFGIEFALKMLNSNEAPADQETPVDLITAAPAS